MSDSTRIRHHRENDARFREFLLQFWFKRQGSEIRYRFRWTVVFTQALGSQRPCPVSVPLAQLTFAPRTTFGFC